MNIGTICFNTRQGIAHLARDFYRNGIINRVMIVTHPRYKEVTGRYPEKYSVSQVEEFLEGLDLLLLFETYLHLPTTNAACRFGIPIVVVPMYEYTPEPFPAKIALYLCLSKLDYQIYSKLGKPCKYLPMAVEKPWRLRERALTFCHNMGHGQYNMAKGTNEVIEAMSYVDSPVRITIRGQTECPRVAALLRDVDQSKNITVVRGNVPQEELYQEDVFVFPEKYNGMSLPLQEAFASGMRVLTTDKFPANEWLPKPLIPVDSVREHRISGGSRIPFDWHEVSPRTLAKVLDDCYGSDITEYSLMGKAYAEEHSWSILKPKYLEVLSSCL